jgi:hypothetical protein
MHFLGGSLPEPLEQAEQRVAFGLSSEVDHKWNITIAPLNHRGRIAANFF